MSKFKTRHRHSSNPYIDPLFIGGATLNALYGLETDSLIDIITQLNKITEKVKSGDLAFIEQTLAVQFVTMNCLFNAFTRHGIDTGHISGKEAFVRLALKFQNQCRLTGETLANLKNPIQKTLVKQTNIGYSQQVNNQPGSTGVSEQPKENKKSTNELLEADYGQRLDTRTQAEAIKVNSHLEPIWPLYGA